MHDNLVLGRAAALAKGVSAGTMDSSKGSEIAMPPPRRKVRRERCLRVMKAMCVVLELCAQNNSVLQLSRSG
jgi:hypothetical protein